jgi:tetratricopeptide (TPR) repeat protein
MQITIISLTPAIDTVLDGFILIQGCERAQRQSFNIGGSSTFAMDHFDQALNFIQAGRLDEARIYLEELLKQDQENVDLLYNLGMLYTDLGKSLMAISLLRTCIEISPRHANAHVALGFAHMSSGDLKSAKEYTLQALKIVPNDPWSRVNVTENYHENRIHGIYFGSRPHFIAG